MIVNELDEEEVEEILSRWEYPTNEFEDGDLPDDDNPNDETADPKKPSGESIN